MSPVALVSNEHCLTQNNDLSIVNGTMDFSIATALRPDELKWILSSDLQFYLMFFKN